MPDVDGPWRCVPCQLKGLKECVCNGPSMTGGMPRFMLVDQPDKPFEGWTPAESATRQEREKSYGPPIVSHTNIGRGWGALLDHAQWRGGDVPPHLVAAMMASLKLCRGVTKGGEGNQDTWLDCAVYAKFGGEFAPPKSTYVELRPLVDCPACVRKGTPMPNKVRMGAGYCMGCVGGPHD